MPRLNPDSSNADEGLGYYLRQVLGIESVMMGRESQSVLNPSNSTQSLERAVFISIHDQWPVTLALSELKAKIATAIGLGASEVLMLQAETPATALQAQTLCSTFNAQIAESGAEYVVCFGIWALACAWNDPSLLLPEASASIPMGEIMKREKQFLFTHPLEAIFADQSGSSSKREAWRHLKKLKLGAE